MLSFSCVLLSRILKLLVEKNKSCVSCKDADGNTPLHLACHGGHSEVVVEILICNEGKNCLNETYVIGSVCEFLSLHTKWRFICNVIYSACTKRVLSLWG